MLEASWPSPGAARRDALPGLLANPSCFTPTNQPTHPLQGRWVYYNDEKVAASKQPPFALGYLYLYRRRA